jgi:hypothetical protein
MLYCKPKCDFADGEVWDSDGYCECAANDHWDYDSSGDYYECVANGCSDANQIWDYYSDECGCVYGEEWDSNTNTCDVRCDEVDGEVWDYYDQECQCPGTGEIWDSSDSTCVEMCDPSTGKEFRASTDSCVCPTYQSWDANLDSCDYNCTQGRVWDYWDDQCECGYGEAISNWTYQCEDLCPPAQVWDSWYEHCECAGWGEVFDAFDDTCGCPDGQFWDTDWEYCECPFGEYWDYWYDSCEWDVFGYYTDAVCEEYDYYEDEYGECIEWTCEALGDRIDELLGEIELVAPQWNDSLGPIQAADDAMWNW